jgi:hypothetical protein
MLLACQSFEEYLLAWTAAFDQGPPELCLANTVEVRTLSGRTLGLIVLPSHPLRLAWQVAYDHLAAHVRYEENIGASRVTDVLSALDSAQFPAMLPGTELGEGFVFGDTLGFHAVAMVSDRDREPKAAISLMASCLAGGTPQTPPSVDQQSAKVLAREIGHYLDCHTRRVAEANAVRSDDASGSCNADETMISAMCTGSEAAFPAMSGEDGAHGFGLRRHDKDFLVRSRIAERDRAADPDPFALRRRDLVAHPFADHLALELGEGQQDVEGEPPDAGRRIERLGDRDEARR